MIFSSSLGLPGLGKPLYSLAFLAIPVLYCIMGILIWIIIVKNAKKYQILPLYLISYLVIVILWPWPPFRFLVPILPFLLAYLIYGVSATKQWLTFIPGYRRVLMVVMGVLLAANLTLVFLQGQANQETRYPVIIRRQQPIFWSSYEAVFNWVKSHTTPDDVIASGLDTMLYLYTGRRGFRPFVGRPDLMFYRVDTSQALGTPEDFLQVMKIYQPRYLIYTPMPGFGEEKPFAALLRKLRREYPGALEPVFVDADPRFVIFAVWPDGRSP